MTDFTADIPQAEDTGIIKDLVSPVTDKISDIVGDVESAVASPEIKPTPEDAEPIEFERAWFREDAPITAPSPGFVRGTQWAIQNGITAHAINAVEDYLAEDDRKDDFQVLQQEVPKVLKEFNLPEELGEELLKAPNTDQMRVIAERAKETLYREEAMSNMGIMMQGATGISGFVLDPVNLLPGAVILKAGKALNAVRVLGKARNSKLAQGAAFGATEEALRNSPRLASDITYSLEDYMTDVGLGAGLGGGFMVAGTAISKSFGAVSKSLTALKDAAATNATLRTVHNIMAEVASGSAAAIKNIDSIKTTIKKFDLNATVRNARDKANEQVKDSTQIKDVNKVVNTFKDNLDVSTDQPSNFQQAVDAILDVVLPKTAKSVGAAERKTTPKEVVGDIAQDIKTTAKDVKETVTKQFEEIGAARDKALKDLEGIDTPAANAARKTILAASKASERLIEAQAARQGIKVSRKVLDQSGLRAAAKQTVSKVLNRTSKVDLKPLKRTLDESVTARIDKGKLLNTIHKKLRITGMASKDFGESIIDWINKNPKKAAIRASHFRDTITNVYNKARQDLEDAYHGDVSNPAFIKAKRALADEQDELESLADWTGMLNSSTYKDMAELDPRWALLSNEYEQSMGEANRQILSDQYDKLSQRFISKQFGTLTESLAAKLVRSKVPLAEWVALNILELPAGTGGLIKRNNTAAIRSQMMEADIRYAAEKAWFDMVDEARRAEGFGYLRGILLKSSNANTMKITRDLNHRVMLEINARQMGKTIDSPPYIKKFADAVETANNKMYELQAAHGIDGITGSNQMKHYMRQSWNDGKIVDLINAGRRTEVIELFKKSLVSKANGRMSDADGQKLAEAIVDKKHSRLTSPAENDFAVEDNIRGTMPEMSDILDAITDKAARARIAEMFKSLDMGKPGYIHKRFLNVDLSTEHAGIKMVDLLDPDVIGNVSRSAKEAAGRSALSEASGGLLRSAADIEDLIGAIGKQAEDMGTHVNTNDLRNLFKQMMGLPYDNALPMNLRKIRDATALAGMNGLGESQLAEFGLALNRGISGMFGAAQVVRKSAGKVKQWAGLELTPAQKRDTKFLGELQEFSTLYEDMHAYARNNVHFDSNETSNAASLLDKIVDVGTGGAYRPTLQYLQTTMTGYSSIRTMQEQVAMAGLMQDAMKAIRTGDSFTTPERFKDIGLDLDLLKRKLNDGTIEVNDAGNIERLNIHRWSEAERQVIGVALRRHAAQQVQMGFAGEMSPLMTNPMVAMLMQFKSYPMLAAEKQQGRNLMHADKEAAMGITINAASSAAARAIRYYSLSTALPESKQDQYLQRRFDRDFAHDTLAYMGVAGMMVNSYDMSRDLFMGDSNVIDQIPAVNYISKYMEAAGSLGNVDSMTERDIYNIQRAMPLGTISEMNIIAGVIREAMATDKESYDYDRTRGN